MIRRISDLGFRQQLADATAFTAWAARDTQELRALQMDSDIGGGFMVAGEVYDQMVSQQRDLSVMRQICRVVPPIEGEALPVPSQEAAMADGEWTTELAWATDETTVSFGQRVLRPHTLTKRVKVSRKLRREQEMAGAWVEEAIADAMATAQDVAFIRGDGNGQPLGLAVDDDVPVYTAAASGVIDADDIAEWIFSLPARFLARARILTTPSFIRKILSIKDGNGHTVFHPYNGRIHDVPVQYSDGFEDLLDATGALNSSTVAAIVGDYAWYWIGDGVDMAVQWLGELYAAENEWGVHAWQETDGLAVIPTAFYVFKTHA